MLRFALSIVLLFGCASEMEPAGESSLHGAQEETRRLGGLIADGLTPEGAVLGGAVSEGAVSGDAVPPTGQSHAPVLEASELPGAPTPQAFCPRPAAGCDCIPGSEPVSCLMPTHYTNCGLGTRYCRDGVWSDCWHVNYIDVQ